MLLKPKERSEELKQRAIEIADLYQYGFVLREIGELYGVSRERIRQILRKNNIPSSSGGILKTAREGREAYRKQINENKKERVKRLYGCSVAEYDQIQKGYSCIESPANKYREQKWHAIKQGEKWDLTLVEWWSVWKGKFKQRGRAPGKYILARIDKSESFCLENVELKKLRKPSEEG